MALTLRRNNEEKIQKYFSTESLLTESFLNKEIL